MDAKSYRYRLTAGYSNIAEEARLECRDGCEIAYQICDRGYYCFNDTMTECPPGTYREPVPGISINDLKNAFVCTNCPPGRYRARVRGTEIDSCTKCPIGKYAFVTGSVFVSDCLRCPAGKFAENTGMEVCKCITGDSCDLGYSASGTLGANKTHYYVNGIDFQRETVPYQGRA